MHLPGWALTVLLGLTVRTTSGANNAALEAAYRAIINAGNSFSTRLYQTVSDRPGNVVMSPVSAQTVMAMAWLGSTGETGRELGEGLRLPQNPAVVQAGFRTLLSSLQSTRTITLDMAIKMYIQQGLRLKGPFRQAVINSFRSDAEEVNMVGAPEAARATINQWVESVTHNKIKGLISPGTLTKDSRLVAVNAVYFRGGWVKPFNESETISEPFYTSQNVGIDVPTMRQREFFYHASIPELKLQAIKMFYRGSESDASYRYATKSMLILLPDTPDGLSALEDVLPSLNLSLISNYLTKKELLLHFPKFKLESTLNLAESLQKLGISRVFKPGAQLPGISDENIYINKVIQEAFIDVSEKGTEAAAATFYDLVNYIGSSLQELRVNRPFLFFILDEPSEAILFIGRVEQPVASE